MIGDDEVGGVADLMPDGPAYLGIVDVVTYGDDDPCALAAVGGMLEDGGGPAIGHLGGAALLDGDAVAGEPIARAGDGAEDVGRDAGLVDDCLDDATIGLADQVVWTGDAGE